MYITEFNIQSVALKHLKHKIHFHPHKRLISKGKSTFIY